MKYRLTHLHQNDVGSVKKYYEDIVQTLKD